MRVREFDPSDERVTCVSCHFHYSRARGFCPMCGALVPERSAPAAGSDLRSSRPGAGKWMALACLILLALGSVGFLWVHGRRAGKTISVVPVVEASYPRSNPEPSTVAPASDADVETVNLHADAVKPGAAAKTRAEDLPELWSRVGEGSVDAEVALAKLYLRGERVAHSCEQARVLLVAASRKQSKAAEDLLSGDYAQQCR
jgi:hypothetical protein